MIGNLLKLYLQDREISDGATREFLLAEAALKDDDSHQISRDPKKSPSSPRSWESSTGFFF